MGNLENNYATPNAMESIVEDNDDKEIEDNDFWVMLTLFLISLN